MRYPAHITNAADEQQRTLRGLAALTRNEAAARGEGRSAQAACAYESARKPSMIARGHRCAGEELEGRAGRPRQLTQLPPRRPDQNGHQRLECNTRRVLMEIRATKWAIREHTGEAGIAHHTRLTKTSPSHSQILIVTNVAFKHVSMLMCDGFFPSLD